MGVREKGVNFRKRRLHTTFLFRVDVEISNIICTIFDCLIHYLMHGTVSSADINNWWLKSNFQPVTDNSEFDSGQICLEMNELGVWQEVWFIYKVGNLGKALY